MSIENGNEIQNLEKIELLFNKFTDINNQLHPEKKWQSYSPVTYQLSKMEDWRIEAIPIEVKGKLAGSIESFKSIELSDNTETYIKYQMNRSQSGSKNISIHHKYKNKRLTEQIDWATSKVAIGIDSTSASFAGANSACAFLVITYNVVSEKYEFCYKSNNTSVFEIKNVDDSVKAIVEYIHSSGKFEDYNEIIKKLREINGYSSNCFIATACYGTYDAPEVLILRQFRDQVLLNMPIGRGFVRCYYTLSPPVADFIASSATLKTVVRRLLVAPAVKLAERHLKKRR